MPRMFSSANPNWHGGNVTLCCLECRRPFEVKPQRKDSAKFCSLACANASMRKAPLNRGHRRGWLSRPCDFCGREYGLYRSHARRQRFCGSACSSAFQSQRTAGPSNPRWAGGLSRFPYAYNFRAISRAIIERDGGKCQNPRCPEIGARMTTHHINYTPGDNRPENLIALCSACNSTANYNKEKWQVLYQGIVKLKQGENQ